MSAYNDLARDLMFTGKLELEKYGLEYRKNKTVKDVNNAIAKAKKNGMTKTEFELSMLELYLQSVFKVKR